MDLSKQSPIYQLSSQLGEALRARQWTVTTAESCTGGGVSYAITSVSGSSEWFETAFVTYSNEAKIARLGVDPATLAEHGAVSEATVKEMAAGALRVSSASVSVAVSGIAGPQGGTPDKPVGTVWFAWMLEGAEPMTAQHVYKGNREGVREQAIISALQGLLVLAG